MPFSDKIKLAIKGRAAFRCCRCQQIGVEVHHIIPQKGGGTDEIDNAAPLCAKCHSDFGDNPQKRKEIKEMREWWYDVVQAKYAPTPNLIHLEEKINSLVLAVKDKNDAIDNLKATLKEYVNLKIDSITPDTSQVSSSGIVNLPFSSAFSSAFNHRNIFDSSIGEECSTESTVGSSTVPSKFYEGDGETM